MMPDVIIKGMEMRYACSGETDCFALDENGDYPMCRITGETRGYTFPIRERRMDNCPLSPAPEWISAEERLPEDEKPVVARYGFVSSRTTGQYFIGTLTFFAFDPVPHWQHESTGLHVTHWMPLPEPPKGGDGE